MTVSGLIEKGGLNVFSRGEDREIESGYCGDFLSNVISRAPESCVWLTVMNNVNVAAVATLIDCACILLCEGNTPDEALAARAQQLGLWVLGTEKNAFDAAALVVELCGVQGQKSAPAV